MVEGRNEIELQASRTTERRKHNDGLLIYRLRDDFNPYVDFYPKRKRLQSDTDDIAFALDNELPDASMTAFQPDVANDSSSSP